MSKSKTFTDLHAPKAPAFPGFEELLNGPQKPGAGPESKFVSAWSHIPTKTLIARTQLAQSLADVGATDLAEQLLFPRSEEIIARMAEMLKRTSG